MTIRKKISYGHQWVDQSDINAAVKVLKGDWLTQGPKVAEFEEAMARYCGAKYAVAVSSGTAALHAAYAAAGIGAGDEVVTTPMTFAATANAVVYCGGRPVFADIQADTLNINPKEILKKITPKTKAIAPVDFAGHPCDYAEILKIAKDRGLTVIEDACHALGADYSGKKIGSIADMTVFSFHPVKAITTGEGGMVVTDNADFYDKLKIFRSHGMVKLPENGAWFYQIENLGYNYRLTDFQSALGMSQLKKLDLFIKKRRQIATKYNTAFGGLEDIKIPVEKPGVKSAWHIYAIRMATDGLKARRRQIFDDFHKEGIGVQVHYLPVHLHPFYQKKFGYRAGDFPVAEDYYARAITLPLFPKMTEAQINYVIKATKKAIRTI
jgi:perosamine synthetase